MKPNDSIKLVLDAIPKIVQVLTPLSAEERQRAIAAAMLLFGESPPNPIGSHKIVPAEHLESEGGISGKALAWMKKNSLTRDQLEHVLSIDKDAVDVIASNLPAKSKRQQTAQAYVLCGLRTFIQIGELSFSDKDARELCEKVGCYDGPNHSNYIRAFGNSVSGSKETGWKLTNPGLSEAAKIVKQLAPTIGP